MKSSYRTTPLYLRELEQINVLPPQLKRRYTIYKNDHDLAEAFIENYAVFHKFYVSVYNKQKLNQKRKHAKSFYLCDAPENCSESDPSEVQVNRSNVDLRNFLPNCFFCGERDCEEKLHRCEKFDVNKMLRKISHELGNTAIMEKLGEGDMIAREAMYHAKCLTIITIDVDINNWITTEKITMELLLLWKVIPKFMFWW